jgi:hypothetical protein
MQLGGLVYEAVHVVPAHPYAHECQLGHMRD